VICWVAVTAVPDIVEFLVKCPPFDAFDTEAVERLAEAVEVEFHLAGATIFSKGAQAVEFLRVIRAGAVEVVDDGRVLDLMGPGEMFGHASMLSGFPTGFGARAAEDTLTYRIPAQAASEVLARPSGLRYVTRSLLEDRHHLRSGQAPEVRRDQLREPVGAAIRCAPVMCTPETSVREAARQLTAAGATALVVDLGDSVGIVTDSDLRSRVVGGGLPIDSPVSAAMTAPAFTVPSDRPGGEVLLDMLDRGIRHFPVVSATGRVVGIVEDHDLVAVESRSSFFLRRAVARASTVDELVETSSKLLPTVTSMTRGGVAAADVMPVFSVVADALTRRALDLAVAQAGEPPARFTWLALGSQARREAVPSSDLDSAIVWFDKEEADADADERSIRPYLGAVATTATDILVRCGFRPDAHRVSSSDPLFVRSLSSWQRAARSFLDDPTQEKALVLVSVLVDSRAVWGAETEPLIAETFRLAPARPRLLRLLAEFALSHKPPTGFLRGLVVEFSGEHRRRLDLKSGGTVPIVDLARWAGMAAGVTCASTTVRLEAASDAGTLSGPDARALQDAFELVCQLRLDHQVAQLEVGVEPDDFVDPSELNPLTRSYMKEAFRAVASVQRHIASDLILSLK
jgi:CBS domain-containing protein